MSTPRGVHPDHLAHVAVHEAGHATLARALGHEVRYSKVIPEYPYLGETCLVRGSKCLLEELMLNEAGAVAEEVVLGSQGNLNFADLMESLVAISRATQALTPLSDDRIAVVTRRWLRPRIRRIETRLQIDDPDRDSPLLRLIDGIGPMHIGEARRAMLQAAEHLARSHLGRPEVIEELRVEAQRMLHEVAQTVARAANDAACRETATSASGSCIGGKFRECPVSEVVPKCTARH